jgi:membrane fusion protein, multidrug efflux system
MMRKIIAAVALVLLVAGALVGIKALQIKTLAAAAKSFAPPPEAVAVATVHQEQWQGTLTAIGSITAVQGVTITPEIAGIVAEISFESGAVVAKGDPMVRLDTSSEEAQLRAVEAQLDLARLNLEREKSLRKENMVSQADLDTADATMKQTQANADTIRATIAKKTIRAPFAGRLGIRQVNLGQFVDVGKPIVWLQTVNPVYADFALPQQEMAQLTNGLPARLQIDAYPDRPFKGVLTAVNPGLDQVTRSVGLRATFENPDQLLRPGMFVRVELLLPEHQDVLVVPATSVQRAPSGDSVYVVEADGAEGKGGLKVRQQLVKLGQERGDFISIQTGLNKGDRVVSAGQFKLRAGMAVVEENSVVPKAAEAPRPSDS